MMVNGRLFCQRYRPLQAQGLMKLPDEGNKIGRVGLVDINYGISFPSGLQSPDSGWKLKRELQKNFGEVHKLAGFFGRSPHLMGGAVAGLADYACPIFQGRRDDALGKQVINAGIEFVAFLAAPQFTHRRFQNCTATGDDEMRLFIFCKHFLQIYECLAHVIR